MSWCDKLAATPTVGIKLTPYFHSSDMFIAALAPLLNKLTTGDRNLFSVERQESFALVISTDDGFQYAFDPTKFSVTFVHRVRLKPVSAGPPVMEMLSQPAPFTKLLPETARRLVEAASLVPTLASRMLLRVGIIASTNVEEGDMPPGIVRMVKYMGRPWKGRIDDFRLNITAEISKSQNSMDRCVHTVIRPADEQQLPTIRFDWQRTFSSGRTITPDTLKELLAAAEKSSLQYFEDLAEGNRFDEEIISKAT